MRSCERCKYRERRGDEVPCVGCIHNALDNFKPMTNADRIRAMDDEELADFLFDFSDNSQPSKDVILEWLKAEVGCE